MPEDSELARRLRIAYLVLCLAGAAWALWQTIPEHRRTEWRLKLLRSCALATSRLARRTGEASMGAELQTGAQLYGVPYGLSRARLALEHAYDRARGALS